MHTACGNHGDELLFSAFDLALPVEGTGKPNAARRPIAPAVDANRLISNAFSAF